MKNICGVKRIIRLNFFLKICNIAKTRIASSQKILPQFTLSSEFEHADVNTCDSAFM